MDYGHIHPEELTESPPQGVIWPILALAFLVGTIVISAVECWIPDSPKECRLPEIRRRNDELVLFVAPGREHTLLGLTPPGPFEVHPAWEPLPRHGPGYQVALAEGWDLPRLPDGWTVTSRDRQSDWNLLWVGPVEDVEVSSTPRYDVMEEIERAEVFFRSPQGQEIACNLWRFGRWGCGLEDWLWVGLTQLEFRGVTRSCLWAHPRAHHELHVRFPQVPVGSRFTGRYGLSDAAAADPAGASVGFTVRVGSVERHFVAENREGFYPYTIPVEDLESEQVDIEYVVTAENDGRRHFCFTGVMQGLGGQTQPSGPPPQEDDQTHQVPQRNQSIPRNLLRQQGDRRPIRQGITPQLPSSGGSQ